MNSKAKVTLFLLAPLVLAVALFGVRWKQEHPTPTQHDFQIRYEFMSSANVILMGYNLSTPNMGREKHYKLTQRDKREIAPHLWFMRESPKIATAFRVEGVVLQWECPLSSTNKSSLFMRNHWQEDVCAFPRNESVNDLWMPLPQTSFYLRQWLAQHPQIAKQVDFT